MEFLLFLFWGAFGVLFAVWFAYPGVLYLLTRMMPPRVSDAASWSGGESLMLSIIIPAHNEEKVIGKRLQNILDNSPRDFDIEIIVMSDNSEDRTVELSKNFAKNFPFISVFETKGERGRAAAHNQGVPKAKGEIVIFTDAETEFSPEFLDRIGHAFDDPDIGFASGALSWRNPSKGVTGESFSFYWNYEIILRKLETHLGIHALGTGACSAVRKEIYRPIAAAADQDFITPLDAILQNYKSIFVPEAIAYDYVAQNTSQEFRARIRMTSKNFLNTFSHWGVKNCLRFPFVSLGLVFHKLFRWLTPFFALTLLLSGAVIIILGVTSLPLTIITVVSWFLVFYALAGAFWPNLPAAGFLWSFLLINVAFAIGVINAITNRVPIAFK